MERAPEEGVRKEAGSAAEASPQPPQPWHTPLSTVTPLSKALAVVLFITLPIIAFWFGFGYQDNTSYEALPEQLEIVTEPEVPEAEMLPEVIEEPVIETVVVTGDVAVGERGGYGLTEQGELYRLHKDGSTTTIVSVDDMELGVREYIDGTEYEFMVGKVLDFWPAPDGTHVAYVVMIDVTSCCMAPPTFPVEVLVVSDSTGSSSILIDETKNAGTDIAFAGWLSDSERFVFYDRHVDQATQGSLFYMGHIGTSTITVFDYLGYSESEVETGVTTVAWREPHFSPTDDLMLFQTGMDEPQVILSSIDGSERKTIFNLLGPAPIELTWSEDGEYFGVGFEDGTKVYLIDIEGKLIEFKQYYKCVTNDRYTVFEVPRGEEVGSDFIVRKGAYEGESEDDICVYTSDIDDVRLDTFEASYLWDIWNDYIIFDQGTSPSPRNLFIYDASSTKLVYSDYYSDPAGTVNGVLEYWRPTNRAVTKDSCAKLTTYKKQGLEGVIEQYYVVDLATMRVLPQGEFRCQPRQ